MRELVLTREKGNLQAYLLEGRALVEYHEVRAASSYALGDIFLGEVTQVVRGLNAAFINLGLPKEGFLHYSDMEGELRPQLALLSALRKKQPLPDLSAISVTSLPKDGNIADFLQVGDWVLVQIVKEMSEHKGPRLSTNLGLTGHTLVMLPFSTDIGVSHRVSDPALRHAWREKLRTIYRPPFGIILRTNGATASIETVQAEYEQLIRRWELFMEELRERVPPVRLSAEDTFHHLLSDLLSPPPHTIHVSEDRLYEQLTRYLREHPLQQLPTLRLHRRPEQLRDFFDHEQARRTLLGRTVTLPNGGYIVIEHTEAFHVIDVNTGSLPAKMTSVEEVIFQTNLLAAHEIARQLRLRDLGGIIIVDFIDMKNPEHRQRVQERLREAMRSDRAKHTILPMSEIGLVQITRQRRRQPIELPEAYPCPVCHGTGKHAYPPDILTHIQTILRSWAKKYARIPLTLRVHPLWQSHWRSLYPTRSNWVWGIFPHRWVWVEADPFMAINSAQLLTPSGEPLVSIE